MIQHFNILHSPFSFSFKMSSNLSNIITSGILGVITEVTLRVRPVPPCRTYGSVVFYNFDDGVDFMREVAKQVCFGMTFEWFSLYPSASLVVWRAVLEACCHNISFFWKVCSFTCPPHYLHQHFWGLLTHFYQHALTYGFQKFRSEERLF